MAGGYCYTEFSHGRWLTNVNQAALEKGMYVMDECLCGRNHTIEPVQVGPLMNLLECNLQAMNRGGGDPGVLTNRPHYEFCKWSWAHKHEAAMSLETRPDQSVQ